MKFKVYFVLFILLASLSIAHLDAGEDKVNGQYLIDFGYSPEHIQSFQPASLVFNLVDNKAKSNIDFDIAWVRISAGEKVIFAGNVEGKNGNAGMTFTFPRSGDYTIDVKFSKENKTLVQESFVVEVDNKKTSYVTYIALALLIVVLIWMRRKRAKILRKKRK